MNTHKNMNTHKTHKPKWKLLEQHNQKIWKNRYILLEILIWALHKPNVDPAPLARSSQSPKEKTRSVPIYWKLVKKLVS